MKFEVPYVLHERPVRAHWRQAYPGNGFQAKLAYLTAKKVYLRNRLAEAQNWRCCWCGCDTIPEKGRANSATIEHVTPRSKGGTDHPDNLAMSCNGCNQRRRDIDAEEFMDMLSGGQTISPSASSEKRGRIERKRRERDDMIAAVLRLLSSGAANPFVPDTKQWRMFERYGVSPRVAAMIG